MKKFLLIVMVMLSLQGFSQKYRIAHLYSADGMEVWDYNYSDATSANLLSINESSFFGQLPFECIDSLFYDENGNITRLSTWQKIYDTINGTSEWFYACYVDYTYNEMNLRTSRKNYNQFGGHFELGGTYRYYYDEEGKMTSWAMEFGGVEEWNKGIIEYNEDGTKKSETTMEYDFSTYEMEYSIRYEYNYDDNKNLERETEYLYELDSWVPKSYVQYEYDELGNCTLEESVTMSGTVQERKIFEYDTTVSIDNVYHYPNPEKDYPALEQQMRSMLKSFEFYAQNDVYELVYVTDYMYDYEIYENGDAVAEVNDVVANIYPNPAQDFVMIESEANYVEVVDVYGRVVFATEMTDMLKVDMSDFATGVYFVKLHNNGATSVQKIMKD